MPGHVHHTAICVADLDASLRFYREGLGLELLMDREFEGDWPTLFEAPSQRLRSVFLGDRSLPSAGIVELVQFLDGQRPVDRPADRRPADRRPADRRPADPPHAGAAGFFLLSVYCDVDVVLNRLAGLGCGGFRRIHVPSPGGVAMATVRDPDGVLVELVGAPTG